MMLEIDGVSFRYRRNHPMVLEGLSCSFQPGSVTAVTGPSGCGKSTLLYLLGLMLRPEQGTVSWKGQSVGTWDDEARSRFRAETVGFVFQDACLDTARSVLDNVLEGSLFARTNRKTDVEIAHRLMRQFSVDVRADHLPGEISGGQAQRVALCRALIKSPDLILGDEPSGNLDSETAEEVWAALHDAALRGAVVVIATHDEPRALTADRQLQLGTTTK
jgi:lipoprotein-releasing system ATP-binding protein